jgi:hypothetical protein
MAAMAFRCSKDFLLFLNIGRTNFTIQEHFTPFEKKVKTNFQIDRKSMNILRCCQEKKIVYPENFSAGGLVQRGKIVYNIENSLGGFLSGSGSSRGQSL